MVSHHFSVAPYIYRSQAKSGTCSFYAYATVYVIKNNKRVTLAIKAVQQHLVWHYLSRLKRSRRQVFAHLFTLKQMLEFLRQTVDRNYGVACEVCLPSG